MAILLALGGLAVGMTLEGLSFERLFGLFFMIPAPGFGTTGVEVRADSGLAYVLVYLRVLTGCVDDALLIMELFTVSIALS